MYCKHCGREIDDNSSFCKFCGKPQNSITEPITETESILESETSIDTESVVEKESVTSICEYVEEESEIATIDDESKEKDNQESSSFSFSDYLLRKMGIICVIICLIIILFGILTAIKQLSLEYVGNSLYFWNAIGVLIGIAAFYLLRHVKRKKRTFKFKEHFESIAFTVVVICIIIVSIVGRIIISRKETKAPVENTIDMKALKLSQDNHKLKEIVQKTNLVLPDIVDEYTTWTNIRIEGNVVICTYKMDDATFDIYGIDVVEYKKEIEENMASLQDKQFLKLCADTNKEIKFRIVSQWDASKSFEILFGKLEVGDLANR